MRLRVSKVEAEGGGTALCVSHRLAQRLRRTCVAVALGWAAASAFAQVSAETCGVLKPEGQYGPFDYRKHLPEAISVEGAHFAPRVEALISGMYMGTPGADIDYLLRVFPNHHRALVAMARLAKKEGKDKPYGAKWPAECYFERALRFVPDDAIARTLYAEFLARSGRGSEAIAQLVRASTDAGDDGLVHYSIGLLYLEVGDPARALEQAHVAMALGVKRTELSDRLKAAGQWRDPPAPADAASAPASTASEPR